MEFTYRRSWKFEIVASLLTVLAAAAMFYFFLPLAWSAMARTILWIACGVNILFFTFRIVVLLRKRTDFLCTLNDEYLECRAPELSSTHTFRLALDEVAEICRDSSGDHVSYRLKTRDGQSIWLTTNYGNPVRKFVSRMLKSRPEISLIDD